MGQTYRFRVKEGCHIHDGRLYGPGSVFSAKSDLRPIVDKTVVGRLELVEVVSTPDPAPVIPEDFEDD